jgi:acetyl-CoA/propionyl-CoA carboxylase biotin carboxyl carrier protein
MRAAGVPIIPGTTEPVDSAEAVRDLGDELGWPIAIKASAGGGGKGLKVVRSDEDVEAAFESARREGEAYFSDSSVYVERYLEDPRHVEVQVLADAHGNVIHLGERDCTIQRRHQKLVEETPSPAVGVELRERIGSIAVEAARAAGYRSAGTIEGLLSRDGEYYFLEMNTRIQVEHTVTEMVTGLDLVREQVLIAAGEPLSLRQEDVRLTGHAIECRINAEDPSNGFLPSPGRITTYREPGGPGVRVDSGVLAGSEVPGLYDPLVAKLIVHGVDREHARNRMLRALDEYEIGGITTLLGFHRALLRHECFADGATCHGLVESELLAEQAEELSHQTTTIPAASDGASRLAPRGYSVEVEGKRFAVTIAAPEPPYAELARRRKERGAGARGGAAARDAVVSPMQGTVLDVRVADGDDVRSGQVICIVEAMKMENEITAHRDGVVADLSVGPGQPIKSGQVICVVVKEGDAAA